ncbi:hypothetical protein TpMuguga_03g00399 [Theileria parva strain Muguga]|uniref:Uncharacterized protein n=1 Tax=Theileria parva TaxID=5875 RepID=Q4MZW0_THEPA|nr:uncharacterized protein TpMuguga_03g00399 [Theileria parva strain Muguga]EAN31136.1 hypothetical protein TpMuguga_03g00399 [Theileria parva strain Muguga]|eukprot:XP_763419.1 hypothetical protein [Theileria parva strain Muguga]
MKTLRYNDIGSYDPLEIVHLKPVTVELNDEVMTNREHAVISLRGYEPLKGFIFNRVVRTDRTSGTEELIWQTTNPNEYVRRVKNYRGQNKDKLYLKFVNGDVKKMIRDEGVWSESEQLTININSRNKSDNWRGSFRCGYRTYEAEYSYFIKRIVWDDPISKSEKTIWETENCLKFAKKVAYSCRGDEYIAILQRDNNFVILKLDKFEWIDITDQRLSFNILKSYYGESNLDNRKNERIVFSCSLEYFGFVVRVVPYVRKSKPETGNEWDYKLSCEGRERLVYDFVYDTLVILYSNGIVREIQTRIPGINLPKNQNVILCEGSKAAKKVEEIYCQIAKNYDKNIINILIDNDKIGFLTIYSINYLLLKNNLLNNYLTAFLSNISTNNFIMNNNSMNSPLNSNLELNTKNSCENTSKGSCENTLKDSLGNDPVKQEITEKMMKDEINNVVSDEIGNLVTSLIENKVIGNIECDSILLKNNVIFTDVMVESIQIDLNIKYMKEKTIYNTRTRDNCREMYCEHVFKFARVVDSKCEPGNSLIWETKDPAEFSRRLSVFMVKENENDYHDKYLCILQDNNKYLLFLRDKELNNWLDITKTRVNMSKFQFYYNDEELEEEEYEVKYEYLEFKIYFKFGCNKVKYDNEELITEDISKININLPLSAVQSYLETGKLITIFIKHPENVPGDLENDGDFQEDAIQKNNEKNELQTKVIYIKI